MSISPMSLSSTTKLSGAASSTSKGSLSWDLLMASWIEIGTLIDQNDTLGGALIGKGASIARRVLSRITAVYQSISV